MTGGVSPYTYSVDGSAFTATTSYTNLSAATYTVEVKDANGCTYSTTASVSNTDGPTAVETTITDAACGASNGSITLGAVTGGVSPYTYSVDGSAFTATTSYTNLSAATYTVEVKDANGCTYSTTASVSNTDGPTAVETTITDAACGASNGSITLGAVTGGVSPYTYSVDGSAFTSTTSYTNLSAGSYTVEVKDANGCTYSTTASVSNTDGPTAVETTITDAACGASNGSISLGAVTGGVSPYTYSVDGSAFTATTSYTNLSAATYTVEVKDANGCTYSTTASVSNTDGPTAVETTITDAACGASNGSITLGAVTGGVSPYTYSVDGSAFTATTSYTNLSAATYTVEVKDANGCTYSTTASVSNTDGPTAVETTITDAACGASNGSITLGAVTGGVSPYTYSVDGSAFTSTTSYTNLSAATYTVEVKDANGCTYSTTASVSNTDGPTAVETTITDAACGASNGSITLGAVTGGVSPYTYSVDGSAFTSTTSYTNLSAGSYTVEVKDANGCTYSTTASVNNTDGPTAVETTITDAACGASNGSITLGAVTGGVSPYTYSVDGSAFTATTSYTNLSAATYTVEVKDANGCTYSTTASVNNTDGPTAVETTITDAACGASNGSITLGAVTGGVSPYTYSVDGSAFTSTTSYTNLSAATYTVEVKDANGCTYSTTASVSNTDGPTAVETTITDAACGASNGSITLGAVTGGVSPYTYSVDGSAFTSTTSYTNLSAGSYTVEVKDANGCTYSTTASVSNTDGPTAVETTITDAACGASNGSISLGAVTGGVSPYTYSVDGSAFTATTSYTNLSAATYTVEVKDANGCTYSTTASVSNTDGPTAVETTITDAACGASNGSISLGAVTGGVSPYTYSVDGSAFTSTTSYTNLSAATYTVEVKDANGCTFSTSAIIMQMPSATAIISGNASICAGTSIGLSVTMTGTGPWTITYTDGVTPVTINNILSSPYNIIVSPPATTTYTLLGVSDVNCAGTASGSAIITISSEVTPTFEAIGPLCQNSIPSLLPLTSINNITGTWSPATINTTTVGTTTYTFTPTASSCAISTTIDITVLANLTPVFNSFGPFCQNSEAPVLSLISINNVTGTWNPSSINTAVAGTTTYTFTPTAGQCATTVTSNIIVTPTVTSTTGVTICSNQLPYNWNNISYTSAGTYNVKLISIKTGCDSIATLNLAVNSETVPSFAPVGPYCSGAAIAALPTTSINNITGSWSPAINNTVTTEYTFTPNGGQCAKSAKLTITISDKIIPTFDAVGPYCSGAAITSLPTTSTNNISGSWSPSINNTATTEYIFTPNAGQCATTATLSVTIDPLPTLSATGNSPATCGANRSIDFTFTNVPNGTYTISYTTGSFPNVVVMGGTASVNVAAGDYNNLAITASGCTSVQDPDITITAPQNPPAPLAGTPSQPTCVLATGSVVLSGLPGGNWTINPGARVGTGASTTITNLVEGTYNFTVTNAAGCSSSATADVVIDPQPENTLSLSATVIDAACSASIGAINITVTGGTAPYTYEWTGPAGFNSTDEDLTALASGDYTVIVTDATGCTLTEIITVGQAGNTLAQTAVVRAANCSVFNGWIDITVTGGTGPSTFKYIWTGPAGFTSTDEDITHLAAGDYSVLVTDANGCTLNATITVGQASNTLAQTSVVTEAGCTSPTGAIDITVTGGTAPYSYAWTGPAGYTSTNEDITALAAGDYTVLVTDAAGCTLTEIINVGQAAKPLADAPVNVNACESYTLPALTNGSYFSATGGAGPIAAGTVITGTQTIYVYAGTPTCYTENSFTVTIGTRPLADAPVNVNACESYTLPALTNGSYFSATGGAGPIAAGTVITGTQTIYVYAGTPTCYTENSFTVTIGTRPLGRRTSQCKCL